tara:strand:- start:2241 stop:3050 length:810 start_codon:yes stop_codon:yes gene_type:complete
MVAALLLIAFLVPSYFIFKERYFKRTLKVNLPTEWRKALHNKVDFYRHLKPSQKVQFEQDIQEFLSNVMITGVRVEVTLEDQLLVASSGVIPLFGFPRCTYKHLEEVILYPSHFNSNFEVNDPNQAFTGMVGAGILENKMILSKPALHAGFDIVNDNNNVGFHEFIHLFDKENGFIDGVPPGFEDKVFTLPWLGFIHKKIQHINEEISDIRSYGANSQQDFFAVAGEYFFKQPHLLKQNHPILYESLMKAFNQDPVGLKSEKASDSPLE